MFVLEKGAIEKYYPDSITGPDKPTKAQNFCKIVDTKELLDKLNHKFEEKYEFEHIFDEIFK
ncbi:MAG: hypothetical protein A2451_02260 [Bdellovibrionales bacterium RIFOXYC2_FULL_39_8]|nr:MAG: hypothetical protein A2451_02260 [Bdellovibrionales bacterium RIFOXYC2_FULL_39_8]